MKGADERRGVKDEWMRSAVPHVSTGQSLDDELNDLSIDGYDVKFVTRVALLPVDLLPDDDLDDPDTIATRDHSRSGVDGRRGAGNA